VSAAVRWLFWFVACLVAGWSVGAAWRVYADAAARAGDPFLAIVGTLLCIGIVVYFAGFVVVHHRGSSKRGGRG
jgi:hypothetical protein